MGRGAAPIFEPEPGFCEKNVTGATFFKLGRWPENEYLLC
jgi:hypothetical protein